MNTTERLQSMVGKTWLYKKKKITILSWKQQGEDITIVTDVEWITKHFTELPLFIELFEHTEDPGNASTLQVISEQRHSISSLKDVLMDSIKRVQENKEYIEQAKSINNNVNTLLNMAKLEVQIMREANKK
jgi:hypothetical protein